MACHVMSTFVRSLPDADLQGNMAVLVVTLLPAILPLSQWAGDNAWYSEGGSEGAREGGVQHHHHPFPSRQAPLPLHSRGRTALLQLLHWLVVTKQPSLHPSFKSIPFLPHQLPELTEARQVLTDSLPPTSQTTLHLRRLLLLLAHHSPEVRYATLRQLRAFLNQNHTQLFNLILGADDTAAEDVISELLTVCPSLPPSLSPSFSFFTCFVSKNSRLTLPPSLPPSLPSCLPQVLLRLSAEEKSDDLSQAVCACLGELGAIDPARVTITLFENSAAKAAAAAATSSSSSSSPGTSSSLPSSAPLHAPWKTNDSQMALVLLQHMLVPKLRAATADKDR